MTIQAVLLPLFLEVILTFALLFWLARLHTRDFASGVTQPENVALREPNWSKQSLQVGYSYSNQFELPVLFYVLTILAWVTRHADFVFVVLAWIFVIFRYLQTSNRVHLRGRSSASRCSRWRSCGLFIWLRYLLRHGSDVAPSDSYPAA
jgi:hypothetical protein